ncbi:MAG: hypothetical protein VX332_10845, partial [Pseudomonadota bacterium]|nr:hypothetical protein [Pseudomonadota bacterium]
TRTTIMQGVVKPWLIGIQMPRTSVRFGAVEMGTLGFGIKCVLRHYNTRMALIATIALAPY